MITVNGSRYRSSCAVQKGADGEYFAVVRIPFALKSSAFSVVRDIERYGCLVSPNPMMEFVVGTRVRAISECGEPSVVGETGTVRTVTPNGNIGIEFDTWSNGHSIDCLAAPGHGWFFPTDRIREYLEIIG